VAVLGFRTLPTVILVYRNQALKEW